MFRSSTKRKKIKQKNLKFLYGIGATIHVGREVQCLPYAELINSVGQSVSDPLPQNIKNSFTPKP